MRWSEFAWKMGFNPWKILNYLLGAPRLVFKRCFDRNKFLEVLNVISTVRNDGYQLKCHKLQGEMCCKIAIVIDIDNLFLFTPLEQITPWSAHYSFPTSNPSRDEILQILKDPKKSPSVGNFAFVFGIVIFSFRTQ